MHHSFRTGPEVTFFDQNKSSSEVCGFCFLTLQLMYSNSHIKSNGMYLKGIFQVHKLSIASMAWVDFHIINLACLLLINTSKNGL